MTGLRVFELNTFLLGILGRYFGQRFQWMLHSLELTARGWKLARPKKDMSSANHWFSGFMLVSGRVHLPNIIVTSPWKATRQASPGYLCRVGIRLVLFPKLVSCFQKLPSFWSNYSDLTRPHPKWWFSKGNHPISGKSRLVKYYNLARSFHQILSLKLKTQAFENRQGSSPFPTMLQGPSC